MGIFFVLKQKWEWDRNRSFVRIRFRRPTSAQPSRAHSTTASCSTIQRQL